MSTSGLLMLVGGCAIYSLGVGVLGSAAYLASRIPQPSYLVGVSWARRVAHYALGSRSRRHRE